MDVINSTNIYINTKKNKPEKNRLKNKKLKHFFSEKLQFLSSGQNFNYATFKNIFKGIFIGY